jgi:uncharacterized cupredoxin-like copper-binding protein
MIEQRKIGWKLLLAIAVAGSLFLASCAGGEESAGEVASSRVAVTAVEYEFQGVPETLPPGETVFTFENAGAEQHEMALARLKEGKTVEELLELPDSEADTFIDFIGLVMAGPGQSPGGLVVDLTPGTYAFVCFMEAPDGEPHALKGMYAQFEVA